MSMFGWGMGDITTISWLAVQVYTAYQNASNDYKHIPDEVKSLQILIDKAAPYFESTSLNNNSRQEGQQALKGCKDVLEGLNSLIEKYNSSGTSRTSQVLRRIGLGTEDIASLRVRLISNTALLNAFIQRLVLVLILSMSSHSNIFSAVKLVRYVKCRNRFLVYTARPRNLPHFLLPPLPQVPIPKWHTRAFVKSFFKWGLHQIW